MKRSSAAGALHAAGHGGSATPTPPCTPAAETRASVRRPAPAPAVLVVCASALLTACGGGPSDGQTAALRGELEAASQAHAAASIDEMRERPDALALGEQLFSVYCAECHAEDGTGTRGVPDLTTGALTYGDSAAAIRATITGGRRAEMPAMGRDLGEVEIGQVVAYVETLGSDAALGDYEQRGKAIYDAECAECHGPEGRGLADRGTPSLTDDKWQHGGSMMSIRLSITRGTESRCPAHEGELTAAETKLLTAWVLELRTPSASRE